MSELLPSFLNLKFFNLRFFNVRFFNLSGDQRNGPIKMTIQNSDNQVLTQAIEWLDAGHRVELVTVARTWGSSPRPPGSIAAVRDDGHLVGSVSGGCIEKQLAVRIDNNDLSLIHI